MKISEAANLSHVPTKTIRYYEEIGIIGPVDRIGNGYRDYDQADIEALCLIRRMRHVGFSVDECRQFLTQHHHDNFATSDFITATVDWQAMLTERLSELNEISQIVTDEIMLQRRPDGKTTKIE